jgi:hypothetical protein
MPTETATALAEMRDMATIAELERRAPHQPTQPQPANAHLHLPPNFSAFVTVEQAVDLAGAQRIAVMGANNYYDYEVYGDFSRLARKQAIFPLYGMEIICLLPELQKQGIKLNDPGNPGKLYLCGKGITRFAAMTEKGSAILNTIRKNDSSRMAKLVDRLASVFAERGVDTGLTESAVIDRVVERHHCRRERVYLQERHVCQAFQEKFFAFVPPAERIEKLTRLFGADPKAGPDDAVKIQNEIRALLLKAGKPGYVPETFIGFDEAYLLVTEMAGIPCYPVLADGVIPICQFEASVEELIAALKQWKIGFAEFIPVRNKPEVLSQYAKAMRSAGLVVTAGTEHNTLDLIPIEPACLNAAPIPDDVAKIFWEGACVAAAHQFLTLNGQPGFAFGCGEDRIAYLAKLGAAVIDQYRNTRERS